MAGEREEAAKCQYPALLQPWHCAEGDRRGSVLVKALKREGDSVASVHGGRKSAAHAASRWLQESSGLWMWL